jgi:predicted O-linked N-acetylglucosamine transferase (SPINDLY family)
LSGRTKGGRPGAFLFRPAFVQVAYLGYPTFTGFKELDFRITDSVIDPESEDGALTSELPLRLPHSMFCYRPSADAPPPVWSPSPDGVVRFGSFNQAPKLSPETLQAWAAILQRVPRSVLVVKAFSFHNAAAKQHVIDGFLRLGLAPERLDIRPPDMAKHDHFAAYRDIDVALDTFPYNGATTTCEALWMGVPVVTFAGETHAQRMGASLLGALGLDELVTRSVEDYVRVAAELAADEARRIELRAGLRQRFARSPLRDEQGFTRGFEGLLRRAWRERWLTQRTRGAS